MQNGNSRFLPKWLAEAKGKGVRIWTSERFFWGTCLSLASFDAERISVDGKIVWVRTVISGSEPNGSWYFATHWVVTAKGRVLVLKEDDSTVGMSRSYLLKREGSHSLSAVTPSVVRNLLAGSIPQLPREELFFAGGYSQREGDFNFLADPKKKHNVVELRDWWRYDHWEFGLFETGKLTEGVSYIRQAGYHGDVWLREQRIRRTDPIAARCWYKVSPTEVTLSQGGEKVAIESIEPFAALLLQRGLYVPIRSIVT